MRTRRVGVTCHLRITSRIIRRCGAHEATRRSQRSLAAAVSVATILFQVKRLCIGVGLSRKMKGVEGKGRFQEGRAGRGLRWRPRRVRGVLARYDGHVGGRLAVGKLTVYGTLLNDGIRVAGSGEAKGKLL